ncbi:MAG: penicillin-binding protein 2 [Candidatus Cloacimonetes bacterium HGW-Cloacimonetes-3]|jgi:penicillin-binding protein 2|nr:MAG: penicillin-binding protein 2 [Candidatus Cloacimonetes bacterium HGW-Cloacimonetes-3]
MTKSHATLVYRITLAVLFALLIGSLFRLQVVKGKTYQRIAESNFVRIRRITATRGEIYDHKYRPIVSNVPSHNLYLTSGKIRNFPALARFLERNFAMNETDLHDLVLKQRFKTYEEILLADNIQYEKMLMLSEQMNYYPELSFRIGSTREYLYPNHFSGYVGRISEKEYELYRKEDYSLNSYIGKSGLESFYEVLLRGRDGREIVQVDAQGRSLELFADNSNIEPLNGLSVVLTIDNDLQEFVSGTFPDNMKGAVVVTDIRSGGILAYVSKPDYDPNLFMQKISPDTWEFLNRSEKPMMDRVIHGSYPPGSVFKPLTAGLGLDSGIVTPYTRLASCVGGMKIGNRFFRCWSSGGHGSNNVIDALRVSCDVYFYDLSLKLNLEKMREYAGSNHLFGRTGIDLPNERQGFFPSTDWYKKTFGKNIGIIGHKVNLSIGQGEVLNTPLQMNAFYAAIANNGIWTQPHLLKQTMGRGRLTREQLIPLVRKPLPMKQSTLQTIREGLWAVVNAPGGTGANAKASSGTVYGKTGSAENSMGKTTHAWFCGYLVTTKPEIAVTVFLENAGGGGALAAPITKRIFDYYIGNLEEIKKVTPLPPKFRTAEDVHPLEPEEPETPPAETETPQEAER